MQILRPRRDALHRALEAGWKGDGEIDLAGVHGGGADQLRAALHEGLAAGAPGVTALRLTAKPWANDHRRARRRGRRMGRRVVRRPRAPPRGRHRRHRRGTGGARRDHDTRGKTAGRAPARHRRRPAPPHGRSARWGYSLRGGRGRELTCYAPSPRARGPRARAPPRAQGSSCRWRGRRSAIGAHLVGASTRWWSTPRSRHPARDRCPRQCRRVLRPALSSLTARGCGRSARPWAPLHSGELQRRRRLPRRPQDARARALIVVPSAVAGAGAVQERPQRQRRGGLIRELRAWLPQERHDPGPVDRRAWRRPVVDDPIDPSAPRRPRSSTR